jgi:hypothetical protein
MLQTVKLADEKLKTFLCQFPSILLNNSGQCDCVSYIKILAVVVRFFKEVTEVSADITE